MPNIVHILPVIKIQLLLTKPHFYKDPHNPNKDMSYSYFSHNTSAVYFKNYDEQPSLTLDKHFGI